MENALILDPHAIETVTASATAPGYAANNLAIDLIGVAWRSPAGAATRSLTIDLGGNQPVDTILLLGLYGALPGWNWSIDLATQAQGAFTGSYWSGAAETLLAGSVMPESGLGRALWRAPAGAPATARYIRINFSALASAAIEVSRVVPARTIQLERNYSFGAARGIRSFGKVDWSDRGVPLPRPGIKKRGLGVSFRTIHEDEMEGLIAPLQERVGNDRAIGIVTDPTPHEQRQNRIWYGWLTAELGAVHRRAGAFQADFNLVALD